MEQGRSNLHRVNTMKQLIILFILSIVSISSYSAPQQTPLDGFKGGPRYQHPEPIKDDNSPQICKLDVNTQSSTEIHLLILDHHINEKHVVTDYSTCMWV